MRPLLAAVVLSAVPAVAAGQASDAAPGSARTPTVTGTLPRIGLPLPPIGLPLPSIGLPPTTDDSPSAPSANRSRRPNPERHGFSRKRSHRPEPTLVFVPVYSVHLAPTVEPAAARTVPDVAAEIPPPPSATGRLRIDLRPGQGWQVYVDGYYLGTSDDVGGELELEPGPHRIEIRATGYDSLAFDVMIAPNRTVTYEGELTRVGSDSTRQPEPESEVPVRTPSPYYVIPGCYIGNLPPHEAGLPPTCDPARAVVVKP